MYVALKEKHNTYQNCLDEHFKWLAGYVARMKRWLHITRSSLYYFSKLGEICIATESSVREDVFTA
jgi:hypothetical protein